MTTPSLLRQPGFRRFWAAQTTTQLGEQTTLVALPLIAAVALDATPWQMSWLNAAQTLPFLVLALGAGVWVDRLRRRRTMIAADLTRAALLLSIPASGLLGGLTIELLCLVALLAATATLFYSTAYQSYLPSLIARHQIVEGNAKLELGRSAAAAAGPSLAGAILRFAAPVFAIAIAPLAHLASAALLATIRVPEAVPSESGRPTPFLRAVGEGIGFVFRNPILRAFGLCAMLWNLSCFTLMTVLVLFAVRDLGLSPQAVAGVLAMQGVGMIAGAWSAQPLRRHATLGATILTGPVLSALACPLFALAVPGAASVLFLGTGLFLLGFGPMIWTVHQLSLRQAMTPTALQGRASATIQFLSWGARPLGALLGGWAGTTFGLRAAIWFAVIGFAAQLLPVLLSPVPRLRDVPAAESISV
ncbi:MAG: MFS transporter [Proteobacteria bacterium]|nr:MFS transporter [Pseudomonadota bacterium]